MVYIICKELKTKSNLFFKSSYEVESAFPSSIFFIENLNIMEHKLMNLYS